MLNQMIKHYAQSNFRHIIVILGGEGEILVIAMVRKSVE